MIKLNHSKKDFAIKSLTQMKNLIIGQYNFLAMTKLLAIKNAVANNKIQLNSYSNHFLNRINIISQNVNSITI